MHDFVAKILDPSPRNNFLAAFIPVAEEIARLGAINSLTQTLLKLTAPGVPDIYQGNEIWDFSLVDPDNRRPVDYERRKMLADLRTRQREDLLGNWPDGRIKLFLTQRLLHFRREHAEFFRRGSYVPLETSGDFRGLLRRFRARARRRLDCSSSRRGFLRVLGFPPIGRTLAGYRREIAGFGSLDAETIEIFSRRPLRANERH